MSLYGESAKSPLEHVWRQFVPQGYDQALRNAFYNVAAIVFVGCVAAAAWSVYMIFQVRLLTNLYVEQMTFPLIYHLINRRTDN